MVVCDGERLEGDCKEIIGDREIGVPGKYKNNSHPAKSTVGYRQVQMGTTMRNRKMARKETCQKMRGVTGEGVRVGGSIDSG